MTENNKKGMVTVFICTFFVTMVFMVLVFADASRKTAVGGSVKALSSLWADSVLAEYDLNLQKRYNLFGFYGYPTDVKRKVEFYAGDSFDSKKYITYRLTGCSLYDYALVNVEIAEPQMEAAGKLAFTGDFVKPEETIKAVSGYEGSGIGEKVFEDLPSAGAEDSSLLVRLKRLLSDKNSVSSAIEKTGAAWHINQYMMAYFKDASDDKSLGPTYFSNEIEYVICGKKSDAANASAIRNRIVTLREGPNAIYLNRDPVKSGEAMAAAQLLTPGPAAVVTKQALIMAWALAESINDYKLLINGHKVPLNKTEATWAVDLESVINNREEDCIYTGVDVGETYQDYLSLLACTMDGRLRILRILDLIQINMRRYYYEDFLLREYNGGVRFVLTVNGETYETVKTYEIPR